MKVTFRLILLLVFQLLLLGAPLAAGLAVSKPPDQLAQLDAYVKERIAASGIPGGGYALVKDGKVIHLAAFGVASLKDHRPLTLQTPMMIGSVGKTITALAIRQLANAGKIELSAPVTRYLPWFTLGTTGAAERITLQNLLDHQSGLSQADGQNLIKVYRPGLTPEQVVRGLKDIQPVYAPGGVYEYSNLNFIILGVVVEAASGQSYANYIQQHIFAPLSMTNSSVDIVAAKAGGLTDGHHYLFGFPVEYEEPFPSGVVPAGYHISSIEDMAHFAAAFSNGGEYAGISVVSPDGRPAKERTLFNIHWEPMQHMQPYEGYGQSGANLNANAMIETWPSQGVGAVVLFNANPVQLFIPEGASNLSNDLLRMYMGFEELAPRSPTVRTVYLYIDAVLLALAVAAILHVLGLRTWRERLEKARSHRWFLARSHCADLLLPLLILLGLPLFYQLSHLAPFQAAWNLFSMQLPDLAGSLLVLAFSLLATGAVKVAWSVF